MVGYAVERERIQWLKRLKDTRNILQQRLCNLIAEPLL
ncbi:hypothetical protein PI172_0218 [Prevotella intermedia]|uniref:Uncharacterized protein n=1 Tax=Prevotella intermedia TaxID=28131 RepID=A0AAD1BHN4_PREIN|nr:hypothetical protein PI172_0218 [Prevotella intermedia]